MKLKQLITEHRKEIEDLKEKVETHRQQNEKIQENLKLIDDMKLQIQVNFSSSSLIDEDFWERFNFGFIFIDDRHIKSK